jgi:uncharacterized iron-regulated protein
MKNPFGLRWRHAALFLAATLGASVQPSRANAETPAACATPGNWIDANTKAALDRGVLFRDIVATPSVVLLGEYHSDADHHRWQLQTLAAIHGRGGSVVVGFEAFPRRLQPVLDDWISGKLSEEAFLKASEWRQVWGYDAALYMPLFEFARLNRIPMIALNVERRLVAQVGRQGWESVPAAEREGVTDPAPADPAYQRSLARVWLFKKQLPPGADPASAAAVANPPEPDDAAVAAAVKEPDFQHFVAAQLTWDRAMAEALAGARHRFPDATVVGILGSGHVEGGHGVPHQLKALGVSGVKTFIPVSIDTACTADAAAADAVFTLPTEDDTPPPERPRLGVLLTNGDGAPRIDRIGPGSVAEEAGLKTGDYVVRAAGVMVRTPDEVVEIVGRQAPGTWLPLGIRRGGEELDVVAKFPPRRQGP